MPCRSAPETLSNPPVPTAANRRGSRTERITSASGREASASGRRGDSRYSTRGSGISHSPSVTRHTTAQARARRSAPPTAQALRLCALRQAAISVIEETRPRYIISRMRSTKLFAMFSS